MRLDQDINSRINVTVSMEKGLDCRVSQLLCVPEVGRRRHIGSQVGDPAAGLQSIGSIHAVTFLEVGGNAALSRESHGGVS